MALKVAVANGNWSNPATWNNGVLPVAGDVVASNNFTVTIDQNINVDSLTNTSRLSFGVVPKMTSNTTPEGIADQSSTYGAGDLAWKAFAQNFPSIGWRSSVTPSWISYQFVSPKVINSYFFTNYAVNYGGNPKDWTFEAWDGTSWIVLHTVTNYPGNLTSYASPNIGNTTSYIKYRLNISLAFGGTTNTIINTLVFYEENDFPGYTTAGGGFILNSGITVTTTGTTGLSAASTDLITFSSNGTATINCGTGNILRPTSAIAISTIKVTGGGTLNITGNLTQGSTNGTSRILHITTTAGAVVNVTGSVYGGNSNGILTDVSCTLNVIGNVSGSVTNGPVAGIWFGAGGTLNITGNVYGSTGFNNNGYGIYFNIGNLNITGNVYGGENQGGSDWGVSIVGIATVYVTGNLFSGNSASVNNYQAINCTTAAYINQVGAIYAGRNSVGFTSSNGSAINILSGPFVSHEYGFVPFQCARMHLIPTTTSYFEFRDETTNGAVSPGPVAPATQLVSPATIADNPIPADVRLGTVYSIGSQTGTLNMPHPNQVTYGVAVDNTFGNAVLTAASVWDYLVASITVENSIGMRLKNVATPQTVGAQLASLL